MRRNDKTGFPCLTANGLLHTCRQGTRGARSEASLDRGVFNPRVLRDPALTPEEMLTMLNIEVWFRVFIDRDPASAPDSTSRSAAICEPAGNSAL